MVSRGSGLEFLNKDELQSVRIAFSSANPDEMLHGTFFYSSNSILVIFCIGSPSDCFC